jgi:hypothetical protein
LPLEGEVFAGGDREAVDVEDVDPFAPRHRERLPHFLELDDGWRHGVSGDRGRRGREDPQYSRSPPGVKGREREPDGIRPNVV